MGLITHNRIYVCIGASPFPVIVDLVIIGSVELSYHYASCLSPLSPSASSSTSLPLPLRRRWLPLLVGSRPAKGWPPLVADVAAPAGGRAGRSRLCPWATIAPTGGCPMRAAAPAGGRPLQRGLAAVGRPLASGRPPL
ncbi:hypothetical protein GW17_00010475 [Ensete ventricosum]|nr:hypothetical protein GW17_00010475 [Ensete ventricosum]